MNKDSKIFVAGHRGLVGSALARKLQSEGYANLILKTRDELNLLDEHAVQDFFRTERPEYVIDSAARVGGIKENMEHQADFLYENLQIQNNLIWNAHKHGVKKFLFLGSTCVYPRECPQPMKEEYFLTGPFEPTNEGYAVAKTAGVKLCEYLCTQYGEHFISVMPCNVYGPNEDFDLGKAHVIPALIRRFHEAREFGAKEIMLWGTGKPRREFMHVDDLAAACLFLLEQYDGREILNVGTGDDIAIHDLAEMIKNIVGFTGTIAWDTSKPSGAPQRLLDIEKIRELGWHARVPLEQGLRAVYDEFLQRFK